MSNKFTRFIFGESIEKTEPSKEYLLLHEILVCLRRAGIGFNSSGSDEKGMTPLFDFQIKTAYLQFGALGGFLNDSPHAVKTDNEILWMNKLKLKTNQVPLVNYTWQEIAEAVETLEGTQEIEVERVGAGYWELGDKIIHLKEKGLLSLNTKIYLKAHNEEKREINLSYSSLITNKFTRVIGRATLAVSIVALVISVFSYNATNETKISNIPQIVKELRQIIPEPKPNQELLPQNLRPGDTLKKISLIVWDTAHIK